MTGSARTTQLAANAMDRRRSEPKRPEHGSVVTHTSSFQVDPAGPPFDPAHMLGCSSERALQLFHGRPVTPGEAEALAEKAYPWRRLQHDPGSYWITTGETARILRLDPAQVQRLLDRGQLPHIRHISRVRLMRRAQILALAQRRFSSLA